MRSNYHCAWHLCHILYTLSVITSWTMQLWTLQASNVLILVKQLKAVVWASWDDTFQHRVQQRPVHPRLFPLFYLPISTKVLALLFTMHHSPTHTHINSQETHTQRFLHCWDGSSQINVFIPFVSWNLESMRKWCGTKDRLKNWRDKVGGEGGEKVSGGKCAQRRFCIF